MQQADTDSTSSKPKDLDEVVPKTPPDGLYTAIVNNNLEGVKEHCAGSYDLNAVWGMLGKSADTALTLAVKLGHLEVVRTLMGAGSDVNTPCGLWRWTPLMCAVSSGHVTVVDFLLQSGADPEVADGSGRTALSLAVERGDPALVERLLRQTSLPVSINHVTGYEPTPSWVRKRLNSGCARSSEDIERLNSPFRANTPLLKACWGNDVHVAQTLLQHGADVTSVNARGDGVLHIAARGGFVKLVQMLLQQDRRPDLDLQNASGETPLHAACRALFTDTFLEDTINSADLENIAKVAHILVLAGCDVTLKDNQGRSSLRSLLTGNFVIPETEVALAHIRFRLIRMILSAAPSMSPLDLPTSEELSSDLSKEAHSDFLPWLNRFLSSPRSLQHLCRSRVRGCVGQGRLDRLEEVTASPLLQGYLGLTS